MSFMSVCVGGGGKPAALIAVAWRGVGHQRLVAATRRSSSQAALPATAHFQSLAVVPLEALSALAVTFAAHVSIAAAAAAAAALA